MITLLDSDSEGVRWGQQYSHKIITQATNVSEYDVEN